MVMIKSTYMDLVNVLVGFYHLPSQEKKISAFENTFFFHFICVVVKMKIFDDFLLVL